jgi:hypothetical protein
MPLNLKSEYVSAVLFNEYSKEPGMRYVSFIQDLTLKKLLFTFLFDIAKWFNNYLYNALNKQTKINGNAFKGNENQPAKPSKPLMPPNMDKDYFEDRFTFLHEFFNKIRTKSALFKIKRKIEQLQRVLNVPKKQRPSYGAFVYDVDSYFIEIDLKGVMRLIETEKGKVQEVRRTKELDELLYWIFTNITFTMACKKVMEEGPDRRNFRMHIFIKQEELLRTLYPHWRERRHEENNIILKNHPVDQIKENGPAYCEALRKLVRAETIEKAPNYFRYPAR